MADIKNTLSFQDRMSNVLQSIVNKLNIATNASEKAKDSFNKLDEANKKVTQGFESMSGKIVTLSSTFQLFNQAIGFIKGVNDKINEYISYAETEMRAQNQLSIITKQRMGLMDDEIRSLYELASAQQKIGVVGDEVAVAGMAGIAAFTSQKSSIEALTPAMNDLAVKMYGYNVTAESMTSISKMLGKAMQGDVGLLGRMGVKIDDVTKKRLMSLREEERAIELAKLIKNVTGDMNEEMAKAPYGQIVQAQNRITDSYERLGMILMPLQARFVELFSNIINVGINAIEKMIEVVKMLTPALIAMATVILVANLPAIIALGKQYVIVGAQAMVAGLKMAAAWLIGLGPIGLITAAVGLLVGALTILINKNAKVAESFWNIVSAIDTALTKFAQWRNRDNAEKVAELQAGLDKRIADRQVRVENIKSGKSNNKTMNLLGKIGSGIGLDKFADGNSLKVKQQGDIGIKEEDMELLNDISTREFAQYYQQLTPTLTIPSMVIHETADVNEVIGAVTSSITGFVRSSTYNTNTGSQAILPA